VATHQVQGVTHLPSCRRAQVLHNRDTFAAMAKQLIEDRIRDWGIAVAIVSLKDIRFDDSMVRPQPQPRTGRRCRLLGW
jgi:regulator of protease activity HflC (stomatin/prohibitin superfamily)